MQVGEVVEQVVAADHGLGTGGARLDDQGPGRVRFGRREVQQRFERETEPLAQAVPTLSGGGADALAQALGAGVEGGEKAVLFVGEVLVEGGAGDAGPFDHLLHVGFPVAEFGGGAEHRRQQPLPLHRADQLRGQFADPGGELAIAAIEQLEGGIDLGFGPAVANRGGQRIVVQLDSIEWHKETRTFPNKTS